jgi:uroporphyrinogen decarboxylase
MINAVTLAGKDLVRAAFAGQETPRAPWVPFVGCHAGALLGEAASDYLQSADLIFRGVDAAIARYQPDGIPVAFDLQIEAEILGCELKWADQTPPAVVTHPLANGTALGELPLPQPDDGRLTTVLEATRRLREAHSEIALFGLVTGPFTLALHLQGTDIFMRMFDDAEGVHRLLGFAAEVGQAAAGYYLDAGCDVIGVVDPMTSQIGEEQFQQFVTPHAQPLFASIAKRGGLSSFFVCGHAQQNIAAMCQCKPDNICVDENIPLDYVRDVCGQHDVSFGGNLQLTTVLLLGKPEDAERNAVECLHVGQNKGFVLAPGCDIPYATPPANLEAVGQLVRDTYRQEAVAALSRPQSTEAILDMSQYGNTDKVVVDIITLDSEACAPCQYMVEAVRRIAPEFEGIVQWREHKIKHPESILFMTSLLVKNVPTICIDGQITFVSKIPPKEALIAAIQERINEKMRDRIRRRRATLIVLARDEEAARPLRQNVERAIQELGADVDVLEVTDETKVRTYGLLPSQTPAIVAAEYHVKSTRHVPETVVIKEWIKSLS